MTKARKTNLFFLGVLAFYLLVCTCILPIIPNRYLNESSLTVLSQGLILFPGVVYVIANNGKPLNEIGIKRLGAGNVFLIMIYALLLVPLISFVNSFSMLFAKNYIVGHLDSMSSNPFWLNLIIVAVMPAFVEEFTFRGIIYTGYRNSTIKKAVAGSAVLFGAFHMNVNQFCYAVVMGIFFALLYEATGSIYASMVAHFTFNANTLVLEEITNASLNYIKKMAETDPEYEKLAEELINSESQSSITDYSLAEKIATLRSLFIVAIITTALAVLLLVFIAKRCNRKEHLSRVLSALSGSSRKEVATQNNEATGFDNRVLSNQEYQKKKDHDKEGYYIKQGYNGSEEYGGKIADKVFIIGIILCVCCML